MLIFGALSGFKRWDVVALLIAMLLLGGLELYGVFGGKQAITITAVIRTYLPKWARALIWLWLGYHFLIQK